MRSTRFLSFLVLGLLGLKQTIRAESFTFTSINVPGAGGTFAYGINNAGQVVGSYGDSNGWHGYVYANGAFTNVFDVPGALGMVAVRSINDAGQVVGSSEAAGGHGFLYDNGVFKDIYYPNSFSTGAEHINNAGQITVIAHLVGSFVYSNGVFTPINVPNAPQFTVLVSGINNLGQIVGAFGYGDDVQGFLDTNGVFTTFRFPGAVRTYPNGINDSGEIVGYYETSNSGDHGFIYSNGVFTSFDVPGANTSFIGAQALDINNAGQIVGDFSDSSNGIHGFLATPVPEPSLLLLLAGGLIAVALLLSRCH